MKSFNKVLSLVLAIAICFSMLAVPAYASGTATEVNSGIIASEIAIDYIYVESPELTDSGIQNILVSTDTELAVLENVGLRVQKDGNEVEVLEADQKADNVLLFTREYKEAEAGNYKLLGITYSQDGQKYEIGITEEVGYCVNATAVMPVSDSIIEDTVSGTADDITGEAIGEGLSNAEEIIEVQEAVEEQEKSVTEAQESGTAVNAASEPVMLKGTGNVVVVLDPGHGGSATGAVYGGLYEKNLNLSIAFYIKEELEKYEGIAVYLTRTTDVDVSFTNRANLAKNVGATSFVSIHINALGTSTGTTTAAGAEVFVTGYTAFNAGSTDLANRILAELSKVGLSSRGVKINNDENGKFYDDGTPQDDLAVIRYNILNGIPAILIEHGFINNAHDYSLLSSPTKLKEMGVADATAIAQYYGLSRKGVLTEAQQSQIRSFATRLYENVLNREPETSGLDYHYNRLATGSATGVDVAEGFVFSPESLNRNLDDSQFIEMLYTTFMDRASDSAGMSYWQSALASGMTRRGIFAGFANSNEFTNICQTYGINRGTAAVTEARDLNAGVTKYVFRCYEKALGRTAEVDGLNFWSELIVNKRITAEEAAWEFLTSAEFQNKGYVDVDYVKVLYSVFLDRECDEAGLVYYMDRLNRGISREEIFDGFSNSPEFQGLLESYGL
ncbi:DUF4214 domain-containing protein [Anaerobium acetethylicum]|uniref:N-acetylmuramoyl-L-alanine amidase n=1 Tax=Anaerobium acetethylicum TaxID=1619234 RepID=A0A1D3TQA9_9FIRM|nr:DUF4214 domain-containing protein [Anaerobium acetethylicum]SCP95741.1 N-acetylmuramoyl-L-alanine amidase [Anaerobium acetethylicum]